ncbi:Xanthine and CO dehydrogenases maturation factor, XdhC/CoxF family [Erythrobacter dokdonensis DSW-74]|jgi:xanthine dehydrogenase accessory factor|uniref:Xanthine and CO dehydrogenases maturation factor, XdhC/CoxF family n=2 Tax=Erythrobacter TaxID=1041 RepID=A0A1A7BF30_9SPHN|nr:Xanthine and CO dehydrogenases maturation factor, XdhC/CoxF family [Erythrobacter dokdonensis DSW-74]
MTAQIDDIRVPLAAVRQAGEAFAIATLVEVEGSAPRECGAQMLVTSHEYWGFLSGGCIEADVARHGREALADGQSRRLRYGEGSPWIDIKLACGSAITVLVEPVGADDPAVTALMAAHGARRPVLWSSDGSNRCAGHEHIPAFGWDGVRYSKLFEPSLRLVLIGEDAAALAAAEIGLASGIEVVLVAPGGPEASPLPGIAYHRSAPAPALEAIGMDRWTAIAVLSHDREDDERGLAAALQSPAFYVGAIGARARLDARLARLRGHGVGEAQIARLHAPIGLQGFGKAPRDIALSLVAEVAQAFHARSAAARSSGVSISSTAPAASVSR